MKTILTLFILLVVSLASAPAQSPGNGLEIEHLNIVRQGDDVNITFTLQAEKRAVKSTYSATLTPVLVDGDKESILPSIVIDGRRAALSRERTDNPDPLPRNGYYLTGGGRLAYAATVPFVSLTPQTSLILRGTLAGCCSIQETEAVVLASAFVKEVHVVTEPVYEIIPPTTGDILAQEYAFVAPLSDFERQSETGRDLFIDENRDRSLTIYFPQGNRQVDPGFRDNRKSIGDILYAIHSLKISADSKLSHIVIAGFASPEGTVDFNQKLAYDRAVALRDYILSETGVDAGLIDIYNGGIDWYGLRLAVENSGLPEKAEVLRLIDNTGDADRHERLKRLNGGATYTKLVNGFFPELRNATYIRVYYENRETE